MSANTTTRASTFVDEKRLAGRLAAMARIGATEKGGVNRQALSKEDAEAQRQLVDWGNSLGLKPSVDAIGNLFLRLEGTDPSAAPVLSGSHLDSQPTGGRFDGVYGVLAAFEAVEAIIASGARPRASIDIVAWMNEEGSRFAPGMMGSAVFAGARELDTVLAVADATGVTVEKALADVRESLRDVPERWLGERAAAYVEAHIEQGPQLEKEGLTIGVVTGIQGKRTFKVRVDGEAAHAGTSTRAERKDALLAAIAMVRALADALHDAEDIVKFTVGRFDVKPSAPSVVPSSVDFSIDLRHPDSQVLQALGDKVRPLCEAHAGVCAVQVTELSTAMSLEFPASLRGLIRDAAARLDLPHRDILSTAGHDARYLHPVCPTGMIFVPSHLGLTHCEAEFTSSADLAAGARVLAEVLIELACRQAVTNTMRSLPLSSQCSLD
ncbi:hydantoinase/carbamoylase family amidase [Caballeronia ptereochthonis]|uniref:Allantoate amidohydrolase n=1 Tax=Caballeronia ptereochthonis TaxID=1777144 RepID=A0A158E1L7_9BURK|nr:hydantoinase/carbamoylase family amidase [Caballeronia ptereochthonis]SAL00769.1 allantoate amidohydrolase [Caballeronia ptereochthonis]